MILELIQLYYLPKTTSCHKTVKDVYELVFHNIASPSHLLLLPSISLTCSPAVFRPLPTMVWLHQKSPLDICKDIYYRSYFAFYICSSVLLKSMMDMHQVRIYWSTILMTPLLSCLRSFPHLQYITLVLALCLAKLPSSGHTAFLWQHHLPLATPPSSGNTALSGHQPQNKCHDVQLRTFSYFLLQFGLITIMLLKGPFYAPFSPSPTHGATTTTTTTGTTT